MATTPLEPTDSRDAFCAAPVGRVLRGSCYLVWCASKGLCGGLYWGSPSEEDTHSLLDVYDAVDAQMRAPYDIVTDASRLRGLDPGAFRVLLGYLRRRLPRFAERFRRNAIVRPDGVAGAMISGLYHLVGPRYPWAVFDGDRAAFAWLERDGTEPVRAQIEGLATEASAAPDLLVGLRAYLREHLRDATLSGAARATGTSERSLQRALGAAGSTFRSELAHARVSRGIELLEASDQKLEAIARAVGVSGAAQLSSMFRRVTGRTPTEVRLRRRRSD